MSAIVRVPTILRSYTGGEAEVTGNGLTLNELLHDLETRHAGLLARVLDENGKIRRFVNIYVNDEDVRFEQGLETAITDGTQVSILAAVAGGR
jgi:molybdopterin synthase sulfur carrier subunit